MRVVDLEDHEERGKFDIEGGGWVEVRLLSMKEIDAITKECTTQRPPEYPLLDGKRQRFEVPPDLDGEKLFEKITDKAIVAFGDLVDKDGKPIHVNAETKVALMRQWEPFRVTVDQARESLRKAMKERQEDAEKNS